MILKGDQPVPRPHPPLLLRPHDRVSSGLLGHLQVSPMIRHSSSLIMLFLGRFRNQQDSRVPGLSVTSRRQRRHRNLVTTKFNLINWALETAR